MSLLAEDEVLHEPPDVPAWVENYLSQAYCPDAGIGFFLHLGGMSFDPRLWNELAVVYLPGDEFVVARSFGYGAEPGSGPRGPSLRYQCVEPYRQWRKSFRGAAQRVSGAAMRAGAVADGVHIALEFDLTYTALSPIFELGEMRDQNWASWHYEQHCAVGGFVRIDGETVELAGSGIRDHSTGIRDLSGLNNHIWCHAQFPSGRSMCLMYLSNADGTGRMNHAAMCVGDEVRLGRLVSAAPLLDTWAQAGSDYQLTFDFGEHETSLTAEILSVGALTICGPGELILGNATGSPGAHHVLSEAMTRFTWDAETGHGMSERTVKL
jgi:hypothetical protein